MSILKSKKCPRCGMKVDKNMIICPSCQLNYNKFNDATNLEAKQALRQGEKERVLMRTGCPADVSRTKLILITIFLGFMGAHYYYVGRNKKGAFYSVFFIVGVLNAVFQLTLKFMPTGDLWEIFTLLVLVWGVVLALWFIDIFLVCTNRFKIPVSREY